MQNIKEQRGSALVISLVILTVITLGAVVAMQRSTLQIRMVGSLQHQQKVFNAATSDLGALLDQLRTADRVTEVLNDAVIAYNANTGAIDPYALDDETPKYGLTKPAAPDNVQAVVNNLTSFEPPGAHSYSLKATEGSSTGTLVPYYFASTASATDVNNSVNSTQQIGFYYLAPAPNQ